MPITTSVVLRRLLFGGALLALATAGASVVLSSARLLAASEVRQAAAAHCTRAPLGTTAASARRVGVLFVRTAVLRRNEVCSYELVTRELQQGLTREQWPAGNIPVQPFPARDLRALRIEHTPSSTRAGERTSFVLLEAPDVGLAVFELVVVARGGRWLVGYWGPAPSAAVLGAPAMP